MNPKTCTKKINGKKVAFIHIPKTGGQSVHKALGMGLTRHLPCRERPRNREVMESQYAFAYVRHPFTRAVSLFHWFEQLHLSGISRRPENAALNQWARNTDVNSFWLQVDVSYLNRQTAGNMFHSQSWFVMSEGRLHPRIDIHRFEDFDGGWKKVCENVGVPLMLPHTNKSEHSGAAELNDAAKARLRELYELDFLNFYPYES